MSFDIKAVSARVPFHRSIRFRLSLLIAVAILLAVMAAAAVSAWREMHRSAAARVAILEAAASAYVGVLAEPLASGDPSRAYASLRGVRNLPGVMHVQLDDADGNVFAQLGGGATLRAHTHKLSDLRGLELAGADAASVAVNVVKAGEVVGRLEILADVTDLRRELIGGLTSTLAAAFLAIAGGVALAQVMIARMTKPIRDLSSMMADVGASQDFSRRMAPSRRGDESAALGVAFNGMLAAINERDAHIARHVDTLEITVEERTHDLRIAKEDAEAANAAKSDFLATMSHEIRTPMNGMMVMAEMLAAADLSSRHRRYAEIISRSGASLLTIINDILDLSKIEAGKLDLEAVAFSPDALVEDVIALFWERARSKGLELALYVSRDVPQQIIGDPTRFNQVITNLVNNALKFTETGGVAVIVTAETVADETRLAVAIQDTGIGIPQDKIPTIFAAFGQADQSTTRRFGGTGLGLTVCKRLVDAMNGEIEVTSVVGQGSVFKVTASFPIEQAPPQKISGAGLKFAVALQSRIARKCVGAMLRDAGCSIRAISAPYSGDVAEIVLATSDQFDRMPDPGVQVLCLSDIGDAKADNLLRSGAAADILPFPVGRRAIAEMLSRARNNAFRGADALKESGARTVLDSFAGLKVLAVDDNAVNREVLREALLTLGVEADFVSNGEEAVRHAQQQRYDVVFMDGSMPVMDGFTATRLIREREVATNIEPTRIIALTAQVRGADADAWRSAGADQHISKPFTAARLVDALKLAGPGALETSQSKPQEEAAGGARAAADAIKSDEAPSGPILDEEAIATMEAVGARSGRDLLTKVWKLFLAQAPLQIDQLADASASPSTTSGEVARIAHSLKSMCLSVGALQMGLACQTLETSAGAKEISDLSIRLVTLRTLLIDTRDAMTKRQNARASAHIQNRA